MVVVVCSKCCLAEKPHLEALWSCCSCCGDDGGSAAAVAAVTENKGGAPPGYTRFLQENALGVHTSATNEDGLRLSHLGDNFRDNNLLLIYSTPG